MVPVLFTSIHPAGYKNTGGYHYNSNSFAIYMLECSVTLAAVPRQLILIVWRHLSICFKEHFIYLYLATPITIFATTYTYRHLLFTHKWRYWSPLQLELQFLDRLRLTLYKYSDITMSVTEYSMQWKGLTTRLLWSNSYLITTGMVYR